MRNRSVWVCTTPGKGVCVSVNAVEHMGPWPGPPVAQGVTSVHIH